MNLSWQAIVLIAAAAQLFAFVIYSALSRAKFPKSGLRRSEQLLIVSAAVVIAAAAVLVDVRALRRPRTKAVEASAVAAPRASCALVEVGMSEAEVTSRLGEPDRRMRDDETRGPGASVLLYASSRCAVHVFDGRVELVD